MIKSRQILEGSLNLEKGNDTEWVTISMAVSQGARQISISWGNSNKTEDFSELKNQRDLRTTSATRNQCEDRQNQMWASNRATEISHVVYRNVNCTTTVGKKLVASCIPKHISNLNVAVASQSMYAGKMKTYGYT